MNWYSELLSIGMKPDCKNCATKGCYGNGEGCSRFYPKKMNKLLNDVDIHLSVTTPKSNSRTLKVSCKSENKYGIVQDDNSLYQYYVQLINDTLKCIRKSKRNNPAYLFHLSQVRDVMRHESVSIGYNSDGDCFEIRQLR